MMATTLTPRLTSLPRRHVTDGEPETVVSASLQKIKSIKSPIKHFIFIFYFIKSETSDSFVSHFDGHFAYLKTLDFYFKVPESSEAALESPACAKSSSVSYPFVQLQLFTDIIYKKKKKFLYKNDCWRSKTVKNNEKLYETEVK